MEMFQKLFTMGLVPVIKVEDAADAAPLCLALKQGGLPVAEITFRTPAAAQAIANVSREMPEILLGAGTVLTPGQADSAVASGAKYIVSPGLNPVVVKHCQNIGVPILPGCSSAGDIETALSLGIRTVKFFPAEAAGGLPMIKALAAPYTDVAFVPTGGINEKNLADYLSYDRVLACGGSWMVPDTAVKSKDWDAVRELTSRAVSLMHGFELRHIGINQEDGIQAHQSAAALAQMLNMPLKEGASSLFAGTGFEIMKAPGRGKMGHIAVGTLSLPRAKAWLESRGFLFEEGSASYKNGKMIAVYLKDEIGGFAIHLLQK
jgi:2-dehydro-3-deoxyphosphogluconate aldolase/(4S)-4-hydroxy-2-oxoglutarate aldolase